MLLCNKITSQLLISQLYIRFLTSLCPVSSTTEPFKQNHSQSVPTIWLHCTTDTQITQSVLIRCNHLTHQYPSCIRNFVDAISIFTESNSRFQVIYTEPSEVQYPPTCLVSSGDYGRLSVQRQITQRLRFVQTSSLHSMHFFPQFFTIHSFSLCR